VHSRYCSRASSKSSGPSAGRWSAPTLTRGSPALCDSGRGPGARCLAASGPGFPATASGCARSVRPRRPGGKQCYC
jgi:hypothetical protein